MRFPCPRCGLLNQVQLPDTDSGPSECKGCCAKINVTREIGKAEHPHGVTIYCASCGKSQPYADRCEYCRSSFTGFASVTSADHPSLASGPLAVPEAGPFEGSGTARSRSLSLKPVAWWRKMPLRFRLLGVCLVLLLSAAIGLMAMQHKKNLEREYVRNYVLVLYGIRSGMELSSKICLSSYAEWQKDKDSGRSAPLLINSGDRDDLETVKKEVDRIRGEMGPPAEQVNGAPGKLDEMYGIYAKLHAMALSPGQDVSRYGDEVPRLKAEFARTVGELKAHMPARLADELARAGTRYNLDFVNH